METSKSFKLMEKDIDTLRNAKRRHHEKCSANSSIDKKEFKFSNSDRTSLFSTLVCLSQFTGKYGDSSIGRDFVFHNAKEINQAFFNFLNLNQQKILNHMADYLEYNNEALKEKYVQELKDELERLEDG